jgi:hypothetical protein
MQRYLRDAQILSEHEQGRLQVELMMLKEKVATTGYTLYQQVTRVGGDVGSLRLFKGDAKGLPRLEVNRR